MKPGQAVLLILLMAGVGAAGYLVLTGPGGLGGTASPGVRPVAHGDREIVWLHTATSGAAWERFVAGARLTQQLHPELGLSIEDENAFPEHTAAVPEFALRVPGSEARLWIRWYKQTSDRSAADWMRELAARQPAPLAVIGGSTSDRALELAGVLNEQTGWHGDRPLLLITTATADKVHFETDLIRVYPERTFRFCFTNSQMAAAVVDFTWQSGYFGHPGLHVAGVAGAGGGPILGALALFHVGARPTFASAFALEWADDPFSLDLSKQIRDQLWAGQAVSAKGWRAPFSVGDYDRPNAAEASLVEELVAEIARCPDRRPILVVPAALRPARRVLRTLAAAAPLELRDAVVLTGDSISFNNIYRDRRIAWHVQDIPLPLVFFCHENPVLGLGEANGAETAALKNGLAPNNGSDDLLLNAVIVQMAVKACVGTNRKDLRPAAGADEMAERLRSCRLKDSGVAFFDQAGNRKGGSGEHVVCLRPHVAGGRVLPRATLEVWTRRATDHEGTSWRLVKSLRVEYGATEEGASPDADS